MNELDWDDALNMIGAAARFLKTKGALKASILSQSQSIHLYD